MVHSMIRALGAVLLLRARGLDSLLRPRFSVQNAPPHLLLSCRHQRLRPLPTRQHAVAQAIRQIWKMQRCRVHYVTAILQLLSDLLLH